MISRKHLDVLLEIVGALKDSPIDWAVTGSLGMALQGMEVEVHDIDIQTDGGGAYEIERRLSSFVSEPVRFRESPRIRSHFGVLSIDGVRVEIMGAIQKLLEDGTWEPPVDVSQHRRWVEIEGTRVPVLSLEHEYRAYLRLGRIGKAERLRAWMEERNSEVDPEGS
jgi:hypothetical protein